MAAAYRGNVLQNGSFETGTASWDFYTNGSFTTAGPDLCTQAARLQFSAAGSNMQFFQTGIALEPNTCYRLSFAAYSNSGRDLGVYLHKHTAGYGSYGLDIGTVNLTTQWQPFTYEFTSSGFSTPVTDGRLRFWFVGLATAGDTYWLDAVRLEKVNNTPPTTGEWLPIPQWLPIHLPPPQRLPIPLWLPIPPVTATTTHTPVVSATPTATQPAVATLTPTATATPTGTTGCNASAGNRVKWQL